MGFYFVVYVLLGVIFGSGHLLVVRGRGSVASVPMWVHRSGPLFAVGATVAGVAALITSLVNHGLTWAAISLAEMALGLFIATLLPMGLQAFMVATSPISVIVMLGALWGFWYI